MILNENACQDIGIFSFTFRTDVPPPFSFSFFACSLLQKESSDRLGHFGDHRVSDNPEDHIVEDDLQLGLLLRCEERGRHFTAGFFDRKHRERVNRMRPVCQNFRPLLQERLMSRKISPLILSSCLFTSPYFTVRSLISSSILALIMGQC